MQNCVFTAGAVTCGVRNESWTEGELRSGASLFVGFTAAGPLADICTAASGEDCITGEKAGWFWRLAGIVPFASELRKGGKVIDAVLDASGKVHGYLPEVQDLRRYHAEDLARLRDQLRIRVQTRIAKTVELGADYGHDARILEEQQLLKSIEKHLEDR
jgi:hypothetical protein